MRDFAIGVLMTSAIWFGVTTSIAYRCARRNEALARYNGALEVQLHRLRGIYNGLSGTEREFTVVKGGRD